MASLAEHIAGIEGARDLAELKQTFQKTIENLGFAAYNFFDAGRPHLAEPFYFGTTGKAWETEYSQNHFATVDPTLSFARRVNLGFAWSEVDWPAGRARKKSGATQLWEAAHDHDFKDGYIFPYHFVDMQGRHHSALAALFWKDQNFKVSLLEKPDKRYELNLVLLYWIQRVIKIAGNEFTERSVFSESARNTHLLSDREREILAWAGRGHTSQDTSDVLKISELTVKTHLGHAMQKLGANNKTHAVAKAIQLGLIDL